MIYALLAFACNVPGAICVPDASVLFNAVASRMYGIDATDVGA